MGYRSLTEIDFKTLCNRDYFPSPAAWEDQVLYFLMVDRFSDGNENGYSDNDGNPVNSGGTPAFYNSAKGNNPLWQKNGGGWKGGNLKGLVTKLGYLKRLGITAIWVSPVLKQAPWEQSYHGYGIQDFLEIDPHFGTLADLQALVDTAHKNGIYVIMDIIFNHCADVFSYRADRYPVQDAGGNIRMDPRWDGRPYEVAGFRDKNGIASLPFGPVDLNRFPEAHPDGAVWPLELQNPETFSRKGYICNWDNYPEFLEGDFFSLKDIDHGDIDLQNIDYFSPKPSLTALCEIYKYWIAAADIDGFRIDTVKHMSQGGTRYFTTAVKEFALSLGKENFYLIGEITGGRDNACLTVERTGIDAALGIDDVPDKLEYMVKGYRNPEEYFSLFRNSLQVQKNSHVWFRNKVVTMLDDHDQVRKQENKARFCAGGDGDKLILAALALNATTLGIPCIYYGSEQGFDGQGNSDSFLRECMFGGNFGSFRTMDMHFFDESNPVYTELSEILRIRKANIALRRGRQYLRPISGNGSQFGFPRIVDGRMLTLIAWSRIFNKEEFVLAINTDVVEPVSAWVTVDESLHRAGDCFSYIYTTDLNHDGRTAEVEARNGKAVLITVPPAGFVILKKNA